jgi:hypothetical protein
MQPSEAHTLEWYIRASDKQEQHTEQDGPNEFPNLRETNQTDNHIRKDSAAAELPKLDPNNHKSKPDEQKPILIIGETIINHIDANK